MDGLAQAAGHADRSEPLRSYCKGLLLPGERKSVEPMAARLAPENVRRMHQSLHHLVADASWKDQKLLGEVLDRVLPAMQKRGPVVAWIVDDTGFPKKGKHSVGVARQYCGQVGKQDNCRVAVSVSVATWDSSLPIAYRLYLPEEWAKDSVRRQTTRVPEEIQFQTKPQIALEQIRQAVEAEVARGVVLADAGYGVDGQFRAGLTKLGLEYIVGVQSSMTVWEPGADPLPAKPWKGQGRPPKLLRRDGQHQPVAVKQLATALPPSAWKEISWREGTERKLRSRFAAVRVRPAGRDYERAEPHPEEWLLMEWPRGEAEPTKYWLSTLPPQTKLKPLVKMAKHRWIIERDYQELKQELGLGHYEGRGWRGFHHHATLCIAAYGFLIAERNRFSPSVRIGNLRFSAPQEPPHFRPRGASGSGRAA
ncbi:MAG TPA: IS701 family transposase [Candidatus Angelobacter sp.]|nr:IS701 family transposase [Candidatus Angelobacter sp.]